MHEYISVKVITLKDLFSDSYHFRLPYFQRAYAWRTAEIGRLVSDVAEAMTTATPDNGRYFLGKLMLAKKPDDPNTALVDGHQRVMSLTLLFAVLRDLEEDAAEKAKLRLLVAGPDGPRLSPQEQFAEFCDTFVQAEGATATAAEHDHAEFSETERNIIANRDFLRARLSGDEWTPELRRAFASFLMDGCCVIVSAVEDEDVAWQFLRIEEETRVEFNSTDCAKWSLLSVVPQPDRAACQKVWEKCEALVGPGDLHALLGHVRTIRWRRRSERPVEIDLAKGLKLNVPGRGEAFLSTELLVHAERLASLRRGKPHGDTGLPQSITECVERMSWIHPQIWVPAALLWLSTDRPEPTTQLFFRRLERLVWMMRIAGFDPTKQQSRIIQLLGEIDRGTQPDSIKELAITAAFKADALANLRSPTFDAKHYDARVLRRISIALGQDPGPVHPHALTIEHILPRAFHPKSGWRKHFPTRASVQSHAHRLGNLTFLTAAENQAADTLEWSEKRPIMARSKLILANRLGATADWTPASITSRTEDLIRILFKAWDLDV